MAAEEVLKRALGDGVAAWSTFRDNRRAVVPVGRLTDAMTALKEQGFFDLLVDVTCVDYLHYPDADDRYGLVYVLSNTSTGERVIIRTFVNDPEPAVPSVYPLWHGAEWMEREVYDMYGVKFEGHPDLRRILMPEIFEGHPLRKDYPLRGLGERHNMPYINRVEG